MESDLGSQPFHPWQWRDRLPTTGEEVTREQGTGIDIRDWMATQMMAAFIAHYGASPDYKGDAAASYDIADAMMHERELRDAAASYDAANKHDQTTG